jgi:hypothetical protein
VELNIKHLSTVGTMNSTTDGGLMGWPLTPFSNDGLSFNQKGILILKCKSLMALNLNKVGQ